MIPLAPKVPTEIAKQIKAVVFALADNHAYLAKSQPENRQFINNLLADDRVGKVLEQYLEKGAIKTYVKDAILNKYSKAKLRETASVDREVVIRSVVGCGSTEVATRERVSLHRLGDGKFVVVSLGTLTKWETALRHAAEFVHGCRSIPEGIPVGIIVLIAADDRRLTSADRISIRAVVRILGGIAVFTDDFDCPRRDN